MNHGESLESRERFSPATGEPLILVDLERDQVPPKSGSGPLAVIIGLDRAGKLPNVNADSFDVLLTTRPSPPPPWLFLARRLDRIEHAICKAPVASVALVRLLRIQHRMSFEDAIECESLTYSALLGGQEFENWLSGRPPAVPSPPSAHLVETNLNADGDWHLVLNDPDNRNAMSAPMRDALYDILANALCDLEQPQLVITGKGKCFSTGGHLPEFGNASDLAMAHVIRIQRSCAVLLNALDERATVRFHGACIGSGLEIFAAAAHRKAQRNAWFQLPEIRMGLIPGAGGTVTVSRAIGRHRAAAMMLSGERITAETALEWGLIQRLVS